MAKVTRQEFVNHVKAMNHFETRVPATAWLSGEVVSAATRQSHGRDFLSFYCDSQGYAELNDGAGGTRGTYPDSQEFWDWLDGMLDSEEAKGNVEYIVGQKWDQVAFDKRGDHPGHF